VDNKPKLKLIYNILRGSLSKTICFKENLSKKQFLKTYGKNVSISIMKKDGTSTRLDFSCPALNFTPNNFLYREFKDPLLAKMWRISGISPLGQPCANCGSDKFIEMHHIKHIRTINPNLSAFDKMVAKINRKQVPLCGTCHKKVHNGTYFGFSLKHFKYVKWTGPSKFT